MAEYLPLIIILVVVAGLFKADRALTILYVLLGLFLIVRFWSTRSLKNLTIRRTFEPRAYLEQNVPVQVSIQNKGLLPVLWLQTHESLPVEFSVPAYVEQVFSLGIRSSVVFDYQIQPHKRGYYEIGPLTLESGDLFGMTRDQKVEIKPDQLTVFPKIVPLPALGLPSRAPFGSMAEKNPIFEDPSRIQGKRDYRSGDSIRRIDWKASAATGGLLVKQFEPSIALGLSIFLDLNFDSFELHHRHENTELAVVTAASIAYWASRQRQSVGLVTNGLDPLFPEKDAQIIPLRKGAAHLTVILEKLARIEARESPPIQQLLSREASRLPWGATIVLISGSLSLEITDEIIRARRRGVNAAAIGLGTGADLRDGQKRIQQLGCPAYILQHQLDLENWQPI